MAHQVCPSGQTARQRCPADWPALQRSTRRGGPEHQEPVAGLPCATTSPGATSFGHDHADALVGARVDIYLRAHPEDWRRLRAQVVWVDIAWLSTERGCLHHRRTVVYARWPIPVTRS